MNNDGQRALFMPCDVSQPEEIQNLFQEVCTTFGIPTIVINNAGISQFKSLFELSADEWDDMLSTNLKCVFLISKEAAIRWKKHHIHGRMVNIASTRAFMSEPNSEAYADSKGGDYCPDPCSCLIIGPFSNPGKFSQPWMDCNRQ